MVARLSIRERQLLGSNSCSKNFEWGFSDHLDLKSEVGLDQGHDTGRKF